MPETHVIAGAGLAGAKAAEALRSEGFEGRIVLIGDEPELPYERPPLSKDYLRGEAESRPYVHDESFYREHDIDLRLGRAAVSLDPARREVAFDDGERVRYDRLLLATGAEPRHLPTPGADLAGILYLRTVEDSDALRSRLEQGATAVVVGAGWIGCEVAASARQRGVAVTLVDPLATPLERVLGPQLGGFYADVHRSQGVDLRMGVGVEAFEGTDRVERVRLSDGSAVECDFAVVGVGVRPRAQLAAQAGLTVDDGVRAGALLETSAPGVFAAGDVVRADHPFFGEPIRVEHWGNALEQGPAAARNMLGRGVPYERLPYFFSDQYDVGMEYAGYANADDRVVLRGEAPEFIAFWLREGRVIAGMNVNVWDVNETIQALIRSRAVVDEARLADPDVPLEELVSVAGRGVPGSS